MPSFLIAFHVTKDPAAVADASDCAQLAEEAQRASLEQLRVVEALEVER